MKSMGKFVGSIALGTLMLTKAFAGKEVSVGTTPTLFKSGDSVAVNITLVPHMAYKDARLSIRVYDDDTVIYSSPNPTSPASPGYASYAATKIGLLQSGVEIQKSAFFSFSAPAVAIGNLTLEVQLWDGDSNNVGIDQPPPPRGSLWLHSKCTGGKGKADIQTCRYETLAAEFGAKVPRKPIPH
jgi:hypothetical protein